MVRDVVGSITGGSHSRVSVPANGGYIVVLAKSAAIPPVRNAITASDATTSAFTTRYPSAGAPISDPGRASVRARSALQMDLPRSRGKSERLIPLTRSGRRLQVLKRTRPHLLQSQCLRPSRSRLTQTRPPCTSLLIPRRRSLTLHLAFVPRYTLEAER